MTRKSSPFPWIAAHQVCGILGCSASWWSENWARFAAEGKVRVNYLGGAEGSPRARRFSRPDVIGLAESWCVNEGTREPLGRGGDRQADLRLGQAVGG